MLLHIASNTGLTIINSSSLDVENSNSVQVCQEEEAKEEYKSWESYTPNDLKNKKHKKLITESENSKQTSWAKLAEIKSKWTDKKLSQETGFAKTEHELRVAQMKQMHHLQTANIVEMHNLQKQQLIEKHDIEMRILQKQLN